MSYVTFSVRMPSDVKKQFDSFCYNVGMNPSTAFNMFARAVIREKRLPFDVAVDDDDTLFYSESNLKWIDESIKEFERGEVVTMPISELLGSAND
jgi:DNA-damage-inducible protein J